MPPLLQTPAAKSYLPLRQLLARPRRNDDERQPWRTREATPFATTGLILLMTEERAYTELLPRNVRLVSHPPCFPIAQRTSFASHADAEANASLQGFGAKRWSVNSAA